MGTDVPVLVDGIRLMTADDLPWIAELARRRYPQRYDETTMAGWLLNTVFRNPHVYLAIRTEEAGVIAYMQVMPWLAPEPDVDVMFVFAEQGAVWQALELLRASIRWAKKHRAARWRLSSDTEYDFGPLAKRLGAQQLTSRYVMEL